jgi:hypothetical protein
MTDECRAGRHPDAGGSRTSEPAAQRLFTTVSAACAGGHDLPTRLEAGLRAALTLLAAEPELASDLTVAPWLDPRGDALDSECVWVGRFGDLLCEAAASDPRTAATGSRFLARFLIGGVRFRIARRVLAGETAELPRLLPSLLEGLLAYYFEPGEPRALADAALARRRTL